MVGGLQSAPDLSGSKLTRFPTVNSVVDEHGWGFQIVPIPFFCCAGL